MRMHGTGSVADESGAKIENTTDDETFKTHTCTAQQSAMRSSSWLRYSFSSLSSLLGSVIFSAMSSCKPVQQAQYRVNPTHVLLPKPNQPFSVLDDPRTPPTPSSSSSPARPPNRQNDVLLGAHVDRLVILAAGNEQLDGLVLWVQGDGVESERTRRALCKVLVPLPTYCLFSRKKSAAR